MELKIEAFKIKKKLIIKIIVLYLQLRLNALGIIVEGPKSTQLFSHREIAWVRQFITNNMNNSNAAFRQQLCSYFKKVHYWSNFF